MTPDLGRPTTLVAELTHRCPLHCPYCSNPLEMSRADEELSTDDWKRVLTQAPRDSQQGLWLVQTHCTTIDTQRRAFNALAFKIEMLWVMIDTIHHAYAE